LRESIQNGKSIGQRTLEQLEKIKPFERVMVFVDGGYLRNLCKKYGGHDNIDFSHLSWVFINMFDTYNETVNPFRANLIRIYYYDAIVEEKHPHYETQKKYFELIDDEYAYTVRLGKLVKSSRTAFKQKGVDILMAIDALTKAYQNHYDTGMFLMGDRDFKPLIEAVKNAGKKTMGVFHEGSSSKDLIRSFDMRIYCAETAIKRWLK
jgi:uncharacterized LabA/DUF88 family protein